MNSAPALPLWNVMLPPARSGQVTQQLAARAVAGKAPTLRERVYFYIRSRTEGATNEEISLALGMKIQTVCGRVNELQKENRVAWTGGEFRDTTAGVKAKVWRACA